MLNVYGVDDIIIVRAPDPAYTEWNEPIDPTEETVKGYVEWKTKLVRNLAGEEVVSSGNVLIPIDTTVNHIDKLKINSVEYPILTIEYGKDFSNVWTRIYFQ